MQPRRGFPGWLTGLLTWLAALLGVGLLLGIAGMAVIIHSGSVTSFDGLWSQFPALVYGRLPGLNPTIPWYGQMLALLPYIIFPLATAAGVGMWQMWRTKRGSLLERILLTLVIVLLLVMAVLVW